MQLVDVFLPLCVTYVRLKSSKHTAKINMSPTFSRNIVPNSTWSKSMLLELIIYHQVCPKIKKKITIP